MKLITDIISNPEVAYLIKSHNFIKIKLIKNIFFIFELIFIIYFSILFFGLIFKLKLLPKQFCDASLNFIIEL